MREIKYIADNNCGGKTVGDILKSKLCVSSRLLPELKRSGGIRLDGKTVTVRERVFAGQAVSVVIDDEKSSENVVPVDLPLNIIYEDEDLLAVSKPKDMPVHPSMHNYENTLGNAVMFYFACSGKPFVYRPITRLDRDTTGIVIIAKNRFSAAALSDMMKNGDIKKTYFALLSAVPSEKSGKIAAPIARCGESVIKRCVDPCGKDAVTEYSLVGNIGADGSCAARVHPITGRTHQIRVHMAHIGCPLKYDYLYGTEVPGKTLILHCGAVEFFHPVTGAAMKLVCPVPPENSELSELLS